jgi:predicted dithiol-disulfide oxidoreductase (DUF899 family)
MQTATKSNLEIRDHTVVPQDEWIAAGQELLAQEKAFTRERDKLSAKRREMPWMEVTKEYVFDTLDGKKTLGELFEGKSQLIVYHRMFAPGDDEGCTGCSFVSDHIDNTLAHLESKDVKYVAVSRGPLADFMPFKKRMGWKFDWVSSSGTTFNYDFDVSFKPQDLAAGDVRYNFVEQKLSVFAKTEDGRIFRTYSTYERGLDLLLTTYNLLDLTPKGRDEDGAMSWVKFHDQYGK